MPQPSASDRRQSVRTGVVWDGVRRLLALTLPSPLKGVVGRLVRKGQHARLILAVDLISQAVSVTVDASDVKAY